MNAKITYGAASVGILGIAAALVFARLEGQDAPQVKVQPAAPTQNTSPSPQSVATTHPLPPVTTARPLAAAALPRRITTYSEQYAHASDLKPIVDQAKLHPEQGSYFYAAMALHECDQLPSTLLTAEIPAGSENDPKRTAMAKHLMRRCENISAQDLKSLRKLGSEGVSADDVGFKVLEPLTLTVQPYDTVRAQDAVRRKLDALYTSSDAGITEVVVRELLGTSDSIILNQRRLTESERSSLPAAMLLLSCDLGAACDTSNFFLQLECVGRGRCDFASVEDYAQRVTSENWLAWTRGTRYDYATAVRLKGEIAQVIARGDRNAFTIDMSKP